MNEAEYIAKAAPRELAVWLAAARRHLDAWETAVARLVATKVMEDDTVTWSTADLWKMTSDRHFALVALSHVFRSADLSGILVPVDTAVRDELETTRDLLEHWDENMAAFLVVPPPISPRRSNGRRYLEANGPRGPYGGFAWSDRVGARLTPHAPMRDVRALLDSVQAQLAAGHPDVAEHLPDPQPSPWIDDPETNGYYPSRSLSAQSVTPSREGQEPASAGGATEGSEAASELAAGRMPS